MRANPTVAQMWRVWFTGSHTCTEGECFLLPQVWERESVRGCAVNLYKCVLAYAHFRLCVITLGDILHMTNEQDVDVQRWAQLLLDGKQSANI